MNGESAINSADILLREIPKVKIGNIESSAPKNIVKEELQFLRLTENLQENILETLLYIHGPEFKLGTAADYEDVKSNLGRKFWMGQGSLVVKGGYDFSNKLDNQTEENERLKQFALFRLESYGFHSNHCMEAFDYCLGNVENSLALLYSKYFDFDLDKKFSNKDNIPSENELLELRLDEKSSLESIYETLFHEKVKGNVWILTLKLDYLINIFHHKHKDIKKKPTYNNNKQLCRNAVRGHCKYGDKCRFSHEIPVVAVNNNAHLEDFSFDLEIRFPPETKYPFEAPIIFLKTNAILPPFVNLHICKRLLKEAKVLAEDGIPCVYTITEMLQNADEIEEVLKEEIDFIKPNVKLFEKRTHKPHMLKSGTHYVKGRTNRNNKKTLSNEEILAEDAKLVLNFPLKFQNADYLRHLSGRRGLPVYAYMKDILSTIERSQVTVIHGETGCGKSTQVPQYILEDWMMQYKKVKKHVDIVCTQPRRISAIGVAERVAEERVEEVGNVVGYQIRLESKMSSRTRLTFCTTGILLRRLESDPTLSLVTHVVVDEVHERSEESDFLLLILRDLLAVRPDLKVILMSATMNIELFSNYFGNVPVIKVPGRTFPVEQYFLEDILEASGYVLEEGSEFARKIKKDSDFFDTHLEISDVCLNGARPKDGLRDENLNFRQMMARYQNFSKMTCKNLFLMDNERINNDLIEYVLSWMVEGDHDHPKEGTILIFLPGIAEITSLYDQLRDHPDFGVRNKKYLLLPLHSTLSSEEQSAIFRKPKRGVRKIILSTNLAETSITIDDCVFVIEVGKMKEKRFDPNRNMESLETVWVTKANALQRKGRAGRVMSGVCIHLYTNHRFQHHMLNEPIPEIHRIPLEQMVLNIKVLPTFEDRDVKEVLGAFIEPPIVDHIDSSISRLQSVGALDKNVDLTPLGLHLAALPVDVRIGKLILYGAIFSCVDAALTMAACLSFKNPFLTPFGKKELANAKKMNFATGFSDQITVLIAYKKWLQLYKKSSLAGRNFANENYLSFRTLVTIADIKYQLLEFLVDIGFVPTNLQGRRRTGQDEILTLTGTECNKNGENYRLLSSVLCAALYPNVIKILTPSKSFIMSSAGAVPKNIQPKDLRFATVQEMVFMHPSSVNYTKSNYPSPYLVYQEKVRTSKIFFRDCCMVPVISMVLFSGFDLDIKVHNGCTFISLENGWMMFQVEEHKIAEMIKMMKDELFALLEEKIRDPLLNLLHYDKGSRIISTILELISL